MLRQGTCVQQLTKGCCSVVGMEGADDIMWGAAYGLLGKHFNPPVPPLPTRARVAPVRYTLYCMAKHAVMYGVSYRDREVITVGALRDRRIHHALRTVRTVCTVCTVRYVCTVCTVYGRCAHLLTKVRLPVYTR